MTGPPLVVPLDLAAEVRELRAAGFGVGRIAVWTGLPHSTVGRIADGAHRNFSDDLTTRQRAELLGRLKT